VYLPVMVNKDF